MKESDPLVQKNSASFVCEVCKDTKKLTQLIFTKGGSLHLLTMFLKLKGNDGLPGK